MRLCLRYLLIGYWKRFYLLIGYWKRFTEGIAWKKVWLPNQNLITNKVKGVSYKLINRIYPVKQYFIKF